MAAQPSRRPRQAPPTTGRPSLTMARAVVLGATGHIGAHVVRALLTENHQVRAAFRSERFLSVIDEAAAGRSIERVRVDLDSMQGIGQALDGCEWVFHAAAYYPPLIGGRRRAVARGVESTRRLIDHLHSIRPGRVVFTSSAATLEEGGPNRLYAAVKRAIEQEMLRASAAGLPVVIVNPSVCLGEYDAHRFSGRLVLLAAKYPWLFSCNGAFNAIYTGDVGAAQVRAAEQGRIGQRYVLSSRHITLRDFAALVARQTGKQPPRWRLPWMPHASEPLDGTAAARELALPQTPIEEAIRRALAWFRKNSYL